MNKKRMLVSSLGMLFLVIVITASAIIIHNNMNRKNDKYIKSAEEGDISRYQWMEMLCEQSGLTEYENTVPYYEDVDSGSTFFPCLQSAVEWGVLSSGGRFEGDGYASGRFVAMTAMKSIGERKLMMYLGTEDVIKEDTYLELALEHGLIEKDKLAESVSPEECGRILARLKDLSFNEFWRDDYYHVVYREGVTELSLEEVIRSNADGTELVVSDRVLDTLEAGTVIVFEEKNTKLKYIRKISGKASDGTLSLSPVGLEQAVESLAVSDITEVTFEDIVNGFASEENTYSLQHLDYPQGGASYMGTKAFSGNWTHKGYKITISTEEDKNQKDKHLEVEITDHETGISMKLPIGDNLKCKGDYSAELDIDKLSIGVQVDFKDWLRYADVTVDMHSTFQGGFKAEEEIKLPLLKIPAPISLAGGFVGVDIQLFLVFSIEGTVSIKAEIPVMASVKYEKGKGLKYQKPEFQVESPRIEANCDADAMLRFEPTLTVLGLDAMDAEVDVGMHASASVTTHPNTQICAETEISFPVLTISVSGDDDADTLIGDFGLSAEWEIITADNAPVHINMHFEVLPDGVTQFVEECTYREGKEENNELNIPLGNTYYTRYKELTETDGPAFCFDYPDGWEITWDEVVKDHETYFDESVELTNGNGARITYTQYNTPPGTIGSGSAFRSIVEYEVEKVGKSRFSLSNESDSAELIVARIKELGGSYTSNDGESVSFDGGGVYYALLLNDKEGLQTTDLPGFYDMCSFYYPEADSFQIEAEATDGNSSWTAYTFIAEGDLTNLTEEEEKEVIAILSSFREVQ